MTRILYKYNPLIEYYESVPILCGHGMVIAQYKALDWRLISFDTGITICEGKSSSAHMLKINIKKELVRRGAIFQDEIRNAD